MAGQRRPATSGTSAKNIEASRSFAFVIKAASSLLTSFSTYLWMGQTLLPMMRRDAVQMVSFYRALNGDMARRVLSGCMLLMLQAHNSNKFNCQLSTKMMLSPLTFAIAPGPPRPDGNYRRTNSDRPPRDLHTQCHDNAYHHMLCRFDTCGGHKSTATCRPSTKHTCIVAALIVESSAVAHCFGTWNCIVGFDCIPGGDTLRCIAVGRHKALDPGLGLRRNAGICTVTHI